MLHLQSVRGLCLFQLIRRVLVGRFSTIVRAPLSDPGGLNFHVNKCAHPLLVLGTQFGSWFRAFCGHPCTWQTTNAKPIMFALGPSRSRAHRTRQRTAA